MAPEFHVVRCFSCEIFQVHQVKKVTTRWRCKVCGEKQSLIKDYGRGSGADCRRHVQQFNAMRGAMMEELPSPWDPEDESENPVTVKQTHLSNWSKYLDTSEEPEPEGAEPEEEQQPHELGLDRKRKRDSPEQSQICWNPVRPSTSRTQSSPDSVQSCDPKFSGACQQVCEATPLPRGDIITSSQTQRPVSSMFETQEDFSLEEFLTFDL